MMSPSSKYHRAARPPFFCNASPVSFSGPPSWKLTVSCTLVAWSARNRRASDGSSTPIHGRLPAACRAAMRSRVSAATIPDARLHSSGPSTSPCSAPQSLGMAPAPLARRETGVDFSTPPPPCAWERTATPLRALLSTRSFQSNCSGKRFVQRSCGSLVVEKLMEDGKGHQHHLGIQLRAAASLS